ncbi:COQ9 family protein [Sphingobium phenoxybenzoativorans]|uniref:COQ9 family protein n=1 Tax=Sphingobium phenoxybenzoativorans TaxID=1592790 RepID=A0A975K7E2_9SPHN|nr:COQ9 family protein [Sphingobium phenoxybenzoativorans]QUT06156.1 COQ9 family protein [Sphingobium phenoxybenzoativorans]
MVDLPADPTLDEIRAALAPLLPRQAAFDGWRPAAVENAARLAHVDPAIARLAFADGAVGMIDAWFASIDARMAAAIPADTLAAMKIRERIAALVEARLALLAPDREALRRALAILALPQNFARSAKLGWRAADGIWRLAGDTATDYNHYTKRMTLGGVYAATMIAFLDDESEGHADSRAFLSRRLDGVMRFEKAKARLSARKDNHFSLSRFIGRLRYPVV